MATWFLVMGVVYAFWQLQEARKITNAQLLTDFYWKFRNDEAKLEKLRTIYELTPDDLGNVTDKQRDDIDCVLDWLDTLGALVIRDFVSKSLAMEVFAGLPAIRCWYKLCRYIRKVRDARGYYAENVEAFARLALDYFKEHHMPAELESVDLIQKLQEKDIRPRSMKEIRRERGRQK